MTSLVAILALFPSVEDGPISRRLHLLQAAVQSGDSAAEDGFWDDAKKTGTPFVEPTSDRRDYSNVTFVWHGNADTRSVLVSTLEQREISNADYLDQGKMSLLPGTDVWYKTLRLRNDSRFTYQFSPNDPLTLLPNIPLADWAKRRAMFGPDPLNPSRFLTRNGDSSIAELPAAPRQPWIRRLLGVPAGILHEQMLKDRSGSGARKLTVYTPAGYSPRHAPYPLLMFFDAGTYLGEIPGPEILDNLIARKRLPPSVAVFIDTSGQNRVRDLSQNDDFANYVAGWIVPWVRKTYAVATKAVDTAIIGSSIGATGATFEALRHPEVFGNVLSQSAGFQMGRSARDGFKPPLPGQVFEDDFPNSEWLANQFASRPKSRVKFYIEIGLREEVGWKNTVTPFAYPSAVTAHRHMRDVLRAKGYEVIYSEFNGGHEVICWRGSLADGLIALLGKSPR